MPSSPVSPPPPPSIPFPPLPVRSFVSDSGNNNIWRIVLTNVDPATYLKADIIAGGGSTGTSAGFADGLGTAATFNSPQGIYYHNNLNLIVTDTGNNLVRRLNTGASFDIVFLLAGGYASSSLCNQQSIGPNYNSLISNTGYTSLWIGEGHYISACTLSIKLKARNTVHHAVPPLQASSFSPWHRPSSYFSPTCATLSLAHASSTTWCAPARTRAPPLM